MESTAFEPMLPPEGDQELEDLAVRLVARANQLAGQLSPAVRLSVGDLVRSMNCYYSNLIEGHNTHPRDIDRALADNYSKDPNRRALQREARAHIEVQRMIDAGQDPHDPPTSEAYLRWVHFEFCSRLPEELLIVRSPQGDIALNQAIGGRWVGSPDGTLGLLELLNRCSISGTAPGGCTKTGIQRVDWASAADTTFDIDYVRVYAPA